MPYENNSFKNVKKIEEVATNYIEQTVEANDSISKALKNIEDQLLIVQHEIEHQKGEKADREAELIIADKELAFQSGEKADRAAELIIADKELAFQSGEKADRAAELIVAEIELAFQRGEKAERAAELIIANRELVYQNKEKDKRAAELLAANKELVSQKEKIKELNENLEFRVKERTEELEAANIEMEAFSYSISHDLKAPLRHITGYISLFLKKFGDDIPVEGQHYFDNISSSAQNMGELIDGLLHYSRLGRIEKNQIPLDMNKIVEAMVEPIKEQDQANRIEIRVSEMPFALGDLQMIESVWSNLIENAVKFTRKKEKAIITIGAEEKEDVIVYYIKDNGAGFDMDYSSKLFAVFQRLHSREDYEGTGIGLATVQRVIVRHGGKIWAEAKVNEGATFYFSLKKEGKVTPNGN